MASPEQQRRVDLHALRHALEGDGYDIVLDARVLLLVKKHTESTVYSNGKVLLKTKDKREAEEAYSAIRPHLEAAWS